MTEPSAAASATLDTLFVLPLDIVRASIKVLQGQRIHEHFPGYLHLRQRAVRTGSLVDIEADWNEVSDLLRVDGGPSNKPHYRPFTSRNTYDPSRYWYQRNLAGSYSPGSIRGGRAASFMLDAAGSAYALPPNHADQALAQMLRGTRVPAWAFAAFYLRDYGFTLDPPGGQDDLVNAFKEQYLFTQSDDFDILFESSEPAQVEAPWFEPYLDAEIENSRSAPRAGVIDA